MQSKQLSLLTVMMLFCLLVCGGVLAASTPAEADSQQLHNALSSDLSAQAPTITVTSNADSGPGSLRQAVLDASDGAVINLGSVTGTMTLSSQLSLDKNVTIQGPGANQLTISGDDRTRLFTIEKNAQVTISALTLTRGSAGGSNSDDDNGGAIEVQQDASLTLHDARVIFNTAGGNGGGIYAKGGSVTVNGGQIAKNTAKGNAKTDNGSGGGGIYVEGAALNISGTTLVGNAAKRDGGGIWATGGSTLTVENATITGNIADNIAGGLGSYKGKVRIKGSKVLGNSAGSAGGIYIYAGSMTIEDTTFANNIAQQTGGGIFNSSGSVTIEGSTITANSALNRGGGGIYTEAANDGDHNMTIRQTLLSGNSAKTYGGGLWASKGAVTISQSSFLSNSADREGGGLFLSSKAVGGTIDKSLFSENSTSGACCADHYGGAIYAGGNTSISNSTVVNNGGAVDAIDSYSSIVISYSTVANNRGTGIDVERNLVVGASIIAANGTDIAHPCCANLSIISQGYNLIGNGSKTGLKNGFRSDIVGTKDNPVDPLLNALADNGGPTQTMSLKSDSPARGHIPAAFCAVIEDQRGKPRPADDGTCDIGAFQTEAQ
jgi:predicted outer membrane repeat protein